MVEKNSQVDKRLFIETLVVIGITLLLFIAFENLRSILSALPAVYFLIERRIRRRSWSDIGFSVKNTLSDTKKNWYWIALVGVVSPILTLIIANYFLPDFIAHVKSRLPMDINIIIPALITIVIGTFLEEIIFRGFIQGRLGLFMGSMKAIAISSILFAAMHYSQGEFSIVAFDLFTILIDSILYGIIFAKTRNLFVSWVGHCLSDLVAMACILLFL